jgi:N-acetylglucosamine-6-phosphate deacetylase
MTRTLLVGGPVFDGAVLHAGHAVAVEGGRVAWAGPEAQAPEGFAPLDLGGDILSPGFVDLQVNGGGGLMLNGAPTLATLETMTAAHRGLGTATLLPTLITDRPEVTIAAVDAVAEAIAAGVPGVGGLHLEGPHLSLARKGAHAPELIRPMEARDLDALCAAAGRLPVLMVTLAPESVTPAQVAALAAAGVVVSLGHTDADYDTCLAYHAAGATCVTHIFNAMSQLGNRAPGLVGAALDCGGLSAGLIADGIHVHPAAMRAALAAKRGPGRLFLVSDAMAPAGTDLSGFTLNGRSIRRSDGRLTLPDGTLAGADLDLLRGVRTLVETAGTPLAEALAMATSVPAGVARLPGGAGRIARGRPAALIRIAPDLRRLRTLFH